MGDMTTARVELGRRGEQLAAATLRRYAFEVVARNWRCVEGEVDLIARQAGEWYFFEVRTRRGRAQGTPEESATAQKRARMAAVAGRYVGEVVAEPDPVWHLGFVAVELDRQGQLLRVTVYPDLESEPLP